MGIIVVGSLNYDLVTYTKRVPAAGETFSAVSFETHAGGKGLNQAISLSKMRTNTESEQIKMVGSVGSDSFGGDLLGILQRFDVDVNNVTVIDGISTGVAVIIVEQDSGQNRIMITAGANRKTVYSSNELDLIFSSKSKEYVVFQHEIPDPCFIMNWIHKKRPNYEIVFNPSPFHPLQNEDWKSVDILVVNEIEALQIAESMCSLEEVNNYKELIKNNFTSGYCELAGVYQKSLINDRNSAAVIITLGEFGCIFTSKEHRQVGYLPSIKVEKVIDTTAAGDTFLGAVVSQLHRGVPIKTAIKFATVASSITITRNGAAESIPFFNEVNERMNSI